MLCTVCGVSLGVQNRFDGLRQIDRLGQDLPEASHDDADEDNDDADDADSDEHGADEAD